MNINSRVITLTQEDIAKIHSFRTKVIYTKLKDEKLIESSLWAIAKKEHLTMRDAPFIVAMADQIFEEFSAEQRNQENDHGVVNELNQN